MGRLDLEPKDLKVFSITISLFSSGYVYHLFTRLEFVRSVIFSSIPLVFGWGMPRKSAQMRWLSALSLSQLFIFSIGWRNGIIDSWVGCCQKFPRIHFKVYLSFLQEVRLYQKIWSRLHMLASHIILILPWCNLSKHRHLGVLRALFCVNIWMRLLLSALVKDSRSVHWRICYQVSLHILHRFHLNTVVNVSLANLFLSYNGLTLEKLLRSARYHHFFLLSKWPDFRKFILIW